LAYILSNWIYAYWSTVARPLAESSLAGTMQSTSKIESCLISQIVALSRAGIESQETAADR
jgi:hypothetical protein